MAWGKGEVAGYTGAVDDMGRVWVRVYGRVPYVLPVRWGMSLWLTAYLGGNGETVHGAVVWRVVVQDHLRQCTVSQRVLAMRRFSSV